MAIFNSLGSNYLSKDVWQHLFARGSKDSNIKLAQLLGQHYGGQAILTYKGREALEIALKASGLPAGSVVGINGFTCYAVYKAVENAGYKSLPIDVMPGQLNFGITELKHAHAKHPEIKALIIQNTLGYPADMQSIAAYCQQSAILLIEDLAHSTGLTYLDGREAGTVGAFSMLSFSQDKPLDVVAGGAMIDRRGQAAQPASELPIIGSSQRLKNRMYPFWTAIIRGTYPIGLGRYVHFILKKLNLMATPMSDDLEGLHQMSSSTAGLILQRWQQLATELAHRREIAAIYNEQLPAQLRSIQPAGIPTYLRFPIWVDQRDSLVSYLRKDGIHIGDTWYDAPIGPIKYLAKTDYKAGTCPNAEELSKHIVNLPTHVHVTGEKAKLIAIKVNEWLKSQPK
ncbi:MAG TPA: DegT/DnrJ/EryC1/StrS family aminotransferase [Patescibacteria group bacterium]|nr:DegT/DnrJ/EryC1/StrS family aminotransferase [Patescibacteria group bacterium]